MQQRKQRIVGFFRDKDGEVHPVTKSLEELNKKRVLKNPRDFKGVSPLATLEKLNAEIDRLTRELEKLGLRLENCGDEEQAAQIVEAAEVRRKRLARLEEQLFKHQRIERKQQKD